MTRPKIVITNVDKHGKLTDKWHVCVHRTWRVFDQESWLTDGAAWIESKLTGASSR